MSITKRLCPQCGTQVQPGQNFCGNCGAPYAEPASGTQPATNVPPATPPVQRTDSRPALPQPPDPSGEETVRVRPAGTQPPPQSAYPTPGEPYPNAEIEQGNVSQPGLAEYPRAEVVYPPVNGSPYPPVNGSPYPPVSRPSYPPANGSPYPPASATTYPVAGSSSYNGPVPYMQPPSYGQSLPPVGYPPYMAPGKPKKRIHPLFIALGIVLVVLVALCGIFAVVLNSAMAPISHSSSSNTASASQTPLPTPTGKPIIKDDFGDNNNNWNLFQRAGYGAAIQKHTLVMSEGNGKVFLEHVPDATLITDFRMDMTYTHLQNSQQAYVGALFRRQPLPTSQGFRGYALTIAADTGQYAIRKIIAPAANHAPGVVNAAVTLASGSLDNSVQPNQQIQVTLIVQGTSMTLYVNGKLVTTCDDSSSTPPYDTGSVNLLLQGSNNGIPAKVAFSHFALYDTGSSGPSI